MADKTEDNTNNDTNNATDEDTLQVDRNDSAVT